MDRNASVARGAVFSSQMACHSDDYGTPQVNRNMNAKIYRICQAVVLVLISTLLLTSCGKSKKEKVLEEIAQIDREVTELNVRIAQYNRQQDEVVVSGIINTLAGQYGSTLGDIATGSGLNREVQILLDRRNQLLQRKQQLIFSDYEILKHQTEMLRK